MKLYAILSTYVNSGHNDSHVLPKAFAARDEAEALVREDALESWKDSTGFQDGSPDDELQFPGLDRIVRVDGGVDYKLEFAEDVFVRYEIVEVQA